MLSGARRVGTAGQASSGTPIPKVDTALDDRRELLDVAIAAGGERVFLHLLLEGGRICARGN